jgi:hypothetical protein
LLDTKYARPAGRKIAVRGGPSGAKSFRAALEQANPGDVIELESGAVFTGNFTLPKKTAGRASEWITIRTSAVDSELPPPGTRVTPAYANRLPKLVSPNADPVLKTAAGAHHYRFIGVEFTVVADRDIIYDLIRLGDSAQTALSDVPHDIIIDRCYIHGQANTNARRGIALNSARTAVIDSYIADIHERGADSQAICGWNGPGPFKIENNYLEAAGENVMFGGADPRIPNLVPSDIEFRRNHCFKPLSWNTRDPGYAGKHWTAKNLFELKNARRVMIEENIFENNWADGQDGFGILFTVRNQDGKAPWSVVEDVTMRNNIMRRSAGGINILGRDNIHPSEQTKRIEISNNLFYDIGGKQLGSNGRFLQLAGTINVTVDHNTVFHTGNVITAYGKPSEGFVFTNNLMAHNEYGVFGDGMGSGTKAINKYFPGAVFRKNIIAGGRSSLYPGDNFFPSTLDQVGFVGSGKDKYRLSDSSPFKAAGTDGRSIGVDMSALEKTASALQTGT